MNTVESYPQGDFALQLERLRVRVRKHCYKILNDPGEADDATQECLAKAWEKRETFRGDSPLENWVMRISTYHCLNLLRKQKGVTTVEWEQSKEQAPADSRQDLYPFERKVWLHQLLVSLQNCMGPRDFWIWRQKVGGLTEVEIARNLPEEWKLGKDGVHSRLQRNIKDCLDKERRSERSSEK